MIAWEADKDTPFHPCIGIWVNRDEHGYANVRGSVYRFSDEAGSDWIGRVNWGELSGTYPTCRAAHEGVCRIMVNEVLT